MNREDIARIRLKVITTTGINILCTALKTQKVSQWLPHFEEAYREVKQDQGDDELSKRKFIKTIRIKKGDYYVANSQVIGDVFEDNDEVICQMMFPSNKKLNKQEKRQAKEMKAVKADGVVVKAEEDSSDSEENSEVLEAQKLKKIIKQDNQLDTDNQRDSRQDLSINKTLSKISEIVKQLNLPNNASPAKQKKKSTKAPGVSEFKKNQLLQKVDLQKLKNLIVRPSLPVKTTRPSKNNPDKQKPLQTNPIDLQEE